MKMTFYMLSMDNIEFNMNFPPRRSPRDFYSTYKLNNKTDTSMNKILIVDASDSNCQQMSGLLTRAEINQS